MLMIASPTGKRWWGRSLPELILVAMLLVPARGGNTTCVSQQLDWYTSVGGESPCMTYQRLRRICNNDYQTPNFSSDVPGDRCNDQVSTCCCNTIAFQLSMLCMVCQQDHQDAGGIGIDAPKGSYDVYRQGCPPAANHTLPDAIQSAVCNEHIRLDNFLYYGGWDVGSWFYVYTKEIADLEHATKNNNTFTHCPVSLSPSPATTGTIQTNAPAASQVLHTYFTPMSGMSSIVTLLSSGQVRPSGSNVPGGGRSKSQSHTSLIGGLVAGGIVGLVMIVAVMVVIRKHRKSRGEGVQLIYDDLHCSTLNRSSEAPPPASAGPASVEPLLPNGLHTEGVPANLAEPGVLEGTSGTLADTSDPPQYSNNGNGSSLRHDDGGPLMSELARSNSGRLPPAYDDSWDSRRHAHHSAEGGQTTNGAAIFRGLFSIAGAHAVPVSKERALN